MSFTNQVAFGHFHAMESTMYLQLDGQGLLYTQLTRALKQAILSGAFSSGTRLPSTRELASILRVSRNTVKAAYQGLYSDGLIAPKVGSGTRIKTVPAPRAPATPSAPVPAQSRFVERVREMPPYACRRRDPQLRYDLQYCEPLVNATLATNWRKELARAVSKFQWQYPPSAGVPELRKSIAEYVMRRRGVLCSKETMHSCASNAIWQTFRGAAS